MAPPPDIVRAWLSTQEGCSPDRIPYRIGAHLYETACRHGLKGSPTFYLLVRRRTPFLPWFLYD